MGYQEFLAEFAEAQGVADVETLLGEHATKYSFQINSRERAKDAITLLTDQLDIDWNGLRVLDIGCAYGSFTIELAKRGAKVVGIDINRKWLRLAEANARDEIEVAFILCDASTLEARDQLAPHGPFDLILLNDVLEHIFDTAGLLANLRALRAPGASLYFKVPNGLATRHVLQEGHKKVFGISLLAPDYWSHFVNAPFHVYYRRWPYFTALFREFGLSRMKLLNTNHDSDIDKTRAHIRNDLARIRRVLKPENFGTRFQYQAVRNACTYYFKEAEHDLATMDWADLHFKYRVTFWQGLVSAGEG